MKLIYTFIFLVAILVSASAQSELDQFAWLLGKWERSNVRSNRTAFENWEKSSDSKFSGIGFTLQDGDTVFVEKLELVSNKDGVFYVANVAHNAAPVFFKIIEITDSGFISENLKHDFPKRIEYELSGNNLKATISGDGKQIPFEFIRID
ncbi:MAG: DUF6265 family protein [Cyclobacteriaceae bacterium]